MTICAVARDKYGDIEGYDLMHDKWGHSVRGGDWPTTDDVLVDAAVIAQRDFGYVGEIYLSDM